MTVVTGAVETETASIGLECCNWDKTVELIGSLPAPTVGDDTERLQVTVKRLRKKPTVTVSVTQEDDKTNTLQLFAGENLRRGMLTRGIKFNDKLAKSFLAGEGMGDCGSDGSCGLCTVTVMEGAELLSEAEDNEKDILQGSSPDKRLSCRAIVGYGMREGVIKLQLTPGK